MSVKKDKTNAKSAGGILIAGGGSGSGKTVFTCGLLRVLQRRGIRPCAFKCGPDYIDPSFHRKALGVPCYNLDPFFTDAATLCKLYERHGASFGIRVVEGVMGYYDGLGFTEEASTYALACALRIPVILLLDCRGMGSSLMAVLEGFLAHRTPNMIAGVIFNRIAPSLYEKAARSAQACGVRALGCLPETEAFVLKSRHLGLVMAEEAESLENVIERIADTVSQTVDVAGILELAGSGGAAEAEGPAGTDSDGMAEAERPAGIEGADDSAIIRCRIAVAQDEAFCFLYEDNLNFLRERGCEIVPFSPLHDSALPACEALYLSGGYPELYAEKLGANCAMRRDVRDRILGGLPCIAECGGFLYLHDKLEAQAGGVFYPMAGVIGADALRGRRKGHFGYIEATLERDGLLGQKGDKFRAHEFHYWETTMERADLCVRKPGNGAEWREGFCGETLYAGFPHLYFYGSPGVGERFVRAAREYAAKNSRGSEPGRPGPLCEAAMEEARARLDAIAKPLDGLGQFEKMIVQIAGIQGTADIRAERRAILAMCADNGIVAEGVTQTSEAVTAIVAANMAAGSSSVNRMAAVGCADVLVTDIGIRGDVDCQGIRKRKIRHGTADFAVEPAMTRAEAEAAVEEGIRWVCECREQGYQILGTGEMGIGNTTTAAAVGCALLRLSPDDVTGRGAGLDDAGLDRKKAVIRQALARYDLYRKDALTVLAAVGGLDIAGLAGIMIGGARFHVPIVLDGMITAAAALVAERMAPGVRRYLIASHLSREPVTARIMEELALCPVIHADMALGEGTGAAMLFPLLDMALAVYRLNDSFEQMKIEAYERYGET